MEQAKSWKTWNKFEREHEGKELRKKGEVILAMSPAGRLSSNPENVRLSNTCIVLDHQESSRRVEIVSQQPQLALLAGSPVKSSRLHSRS
jgi:hypothetical protein